MAIRKREEGFKGGDSNFVVAGYNLMDIKTIFSCIGFLIVLFFAWKYFKSQNP